VHSSVIVEASHGERPPLHVVLSTSPVALNWCSTQHAGMGVGTAVGMDVGTGVGLGENVGSTEGWDVGTDVGVFVGTVVGVGVGFSTVGSAVGTAVGVFVGVFVGVDVGDVGTEVGAAVGTFVAVVGSGVGTGVGKIVGTGVGKIVGTVVSSSRRAPSRRPLDRRAFGPLRGGRCPPTTALRSQHRQAIMKTTAAPPPDVLWAAVHAGFQSGLQRREGQYHTCRSSDDGLKGAFFHRA
jgi:hypothetical protein